MEGLGVGIREASERRRVNGHEYKSSGELLIKNVLSVSKNTTSDDGHLSLRERP